MSKRKIPKKENINHPDHYNSLNAKCSVCGFRIECIDVVGNMSFNLGNVIKYVWRCDHKESDVSDLRKALWYLQNEIKKRERKKR